jgi:hypothetical protein
LPWDVKGLVPLSGVMRGLRAAAANEKRDESGLAGDKACRQ